MHVEMRRLRARPAALLGLLLRVDRCVHDRVVRMRNGHNARCTRDNNTRNPILGIFDA